MNRTGKTCLYFLCNQDGTIDDAEIPWQEADQFTGIHYSFLFRLKDKQDLDLFLARIIEHNNRTVSSAATLAEDNTRLYLTGAAVGDKVLICGCTDNHKLPDCFSGFLLQYINRILQNSNIDNDHNNNTGFLDKMMAINNELIGTKRDLYKTNQKLKILNSEKDKFFSIIAHDLRSPFAHLLGFSELILKKIQEDDREKALVFAENMINASKKTFALLENLLKWSMSETGQANYDPHPHFLRPLVNECLDHIEGIAGSKRIRVKNEVEQETEVMADKNMLKTIIRNLVSNAIKFSHPNGEVVITSTRSGEMAGITVSDNGTGIDEETRSKLFTVLTESRKGTANEQGSGLGLVLCRNFTEKHGGNIKVDSTPGKGSRFTFTIPLAKL